ncbi:MAG: hypothetical protein WD226_09630 [Planctomycetota bacterium]
MPSDASPSPRLRVAWICLGVLLAWRVGLALVAIGDALWFAVPPDVRVGRFTQALTDSLDERFERGWAYGEARRGLPVGRAHELFLALREHVPETGIVALVVTGADQFLGHLRGALFPRKVHLTDRLHVPQGAPSELYLVTFSESDAAEAARWFEPLEAGNGWRLWKLEEAPR